MRFEQYRIEYKIAKIDTIYITKEWTEARCQTNIVKISWKVEKQKEETEVYGGRNK